MSDPIVALAGLTFILLCLFGLGVGVKIELLIRSEYSEVWRKLGIQTRIHYQFSHKMKISMQKRKLRWCALCGRRKVFSRLIHA